MRLVWRAFSILERIVVVETPVLDQYPEFRISFQYPRTDRGG